MQILFDLDGTISDPFVGISRSIAYALTKLGLEVNDTDRLKKYIGPPLLKSFGEILETNDQECIDSALNLYRERYGSIGMYEATIYKDIEFVLQKLCEHNHTLFVATAKPTIYAEKIIRHFALERYFQKVYGSELDGTRNDKSTLINFIIKKESLTPSDTYMIGDREYDMIGAVDNNISPIGVLWGYGRLEELTEGGASFCAHNPKEIFSFLS